MLKYSHFLGQNEAGPTVVPLFGPADAHFEKVASAHLMPEVTQYISGLNPQNESQYVLVNALGSGEFYSSNVNGDHFPEAALIHRPDNWAGNPALDRITAAKWAYGFPTFYNAHPFAHHRNQDPTRAFGEVELAAWNPHMHRVELVARVDHDKCEQYGGTATWDKLKAGQFVDVSMGSKVPFDTCSICLDKKLYDEALATYNPNQHTHPGQAVLQFHRALIAQGKRGIQGLSITRKDYCQHALQQMNVILPDGRKVFVYNDFPRFFDISFVFIGADRTAKTMLFIFSGGKRWNVRPSTDVANDVLGEKTASAIDVMLADGTPLQLTNIKVASEQKKADIEKDTIPSNLVDKAVPLMTQHEDDLPRGVLDGLSQLPLENSLSSLGALGIVLRPREFQRLALSGLGQGDLADELEQKNQVFPQVEESESVGLSPQAFLPQLLSSLEPLLAARSGLAPAVERRALVSGSIAGEQKTASASLSTPLLRKIGAAYNGYRNELMDTVAHCQNLLDTSKGVSASLAKLASAPVESVFTPLAVYYLQHAFLDEVGRGE